MCCRNCSKKEGDFPGHSKSTDSSVSKGDLHVACHNHSKSEVIWSMQGEGCTLLRCFHTSKELSVQINHQLS